MDKEGVEPVEEKEKTLDNSDFLSRLRKNYLGTPSIVRMSGSTGKHVRRVLKKAVQQGRSERRGEAYASVR